jgi:hypothetical protein
MKHPILKAGNFRLSNSENATESELSLIKFVKRIFTKFGITFIDPCCLPTDMQPLRYNSGTDKVQGFNGEGWVDLGTLAP